MNPREDKSSGCRPHAVPLDYRPPRPRHRTDPVIRPWPELRPWAAAAVGGLTALVWFVGGVLFYPLRFVVDHRGPDWLSTAFDILHALMLPLPAIALWLEWNANVSGAQEGQVLFRLTIVNSLLYGCIGALCYRWWTRRRGCEE